jgi:hypothetical protein
MTLELMKELFGIAHIIGDEEEAPNVMCMHVGEEEVSMSQPITAAVPPEEDDVLVPQGLHRLLPEEEDIPVPLERPPYHSPSTPCHGPKGKMGMPCPCTSLGKFFTLLFFSKTQEIHLALFLINVVVF